MKAITHQDALYCSCKRYCHYTLFGVHTYFTTPSQFLSSSLTKQISAVIFMFIFLSCEHEKNCFKTHFHSSSAINTLYCDVNLEIVSVFIPVYNQTIWPPIKLDIEWRSACNLRATLMIRIFTSSVLIVNYFRSSWKRLHYWMLLSTVSYFHLWWKWMEHISDQGRI